MLTMVDKGRQRFGSKSLDLRIVSVLAGLLKKFDVLAVVINAHFPDELLVEMLGLGDRSEEHTSELQSRQYLVCRLLLEKKKKKKHKRVTFSYTYKERNVSDLSKYS